MHRSSTRTSIDLIVDELPTWWFIPLSKWVIPPVINGISRVNPLITGVITHLLSGMNHQAGSMLIKGSEKSPPPVN